MCNITGSKTRYWARIVDFQKTTCYIRMSFQKKRALYQNAIFSVFKGDLNYSSIKHAA